MHWKKRRKVLTYSKVRLYGKIHWIVGSELEKKIMEKEKKKKQVGVKL